MIRNSAVGRLAAAVLVAMTVVAATAYSQSGAPNAPAFDVASVKVNNSGSVGMSIQSRAGGTFHARNVPLKNLIRRAYGLQIYQIVGGPNWLESARFDVEARAGQDVPFDSPEIMLMLRTLLAERFSLQVHVERRDMPTYDLVAMAPDGKVRTGLRPSAIDCSAITAKASQSAAQPENGGAVPNCNLRIGGTATLSVNGVTIARFAEFLQPEVNRMIVDKTGLTGTFDVQLNFALNLPVPQPEPSLFVALPEQLGLRLESRRGPVEVLVVDQATAPSDN